MVWFILWYVMSFLFLLFVMIVFFILVIILLIELLIFLDEIVDFLRRFVSMVVSFKSLVSFVLLKLGVFMVIILSDMLELNFLFFVWIFKIFVFLWMFGMLMVICTKI